MGSKLMGARSQGQLCVEFMPGWSLLICKTVLNVNWGGGYMYLLIDVSHTPMLNNYVIPVYWFLNCAIIYKSKSLVKISYSFNRTSLSFYNFLWIYIFNKKFKDKLSVYQTLKAHFEGVKER